MNPFLYAKAKVALERSDGDEKAAVDELTAMVDGDPELHDALPRGGAAGAVYLAKRGRNDGAPKTSIVTAAREMIRRRSTR